MGKFVPSVGDLHNASESVTSSVPFAAACNEVSDDICQLLIHNIYSRISIPLILYMTWANNYIQKLKRQCHVNLNPMYSLYI